ncbi:hypothetical protein C8R43DRAFT_1140877 [Mycena crocata]|nr:hypothetical protein C8R43DRAFT_1140877 [Mycena crocata]
MSPPSPTTQFDRVSAGFRPTMRAPFVTSELKAVSKAERQAKLDHLQQLRAQAKAKKRPPVKIPVPGLPFPTSPPIIPTPPAPPTPSPPKTPSKTRWPPPEELPIFDCRRCRRELFPRSFCRCGTATQRAAARKIADDAWFKEDPNGWFEYHAPPQTVITVPIMHYTWPWPGSIMHYLRPDASGRMGNNALSREFVPLYATYM